MKRSPKLRPNLWDGIVVALVVVLAVACGVAVWGRNDTAGELTVVVSVDGEEIQRCALTEFPDAEQAYSANGYTLCVSLDQEIYPDRLGIHVEASDCPTQDCVHTGTITRAGQSIVCLPARIIIQLEGAAADDGGPDLVIG